MRMILNCKRNAMTTIASVSPYNPFPLTKFQRPELSLT